MYPTFIDSQYQGGSSLKSLEPVERQHIAKRLGLDDAAALPKKLSELAFVRGHIGKLPPLCWALFDVLLELGGGALLETWELRACERFSFPRPAIRRGIAQIMGTGFVVGHFGRNGRIGFLELLRECRDTIAKLVAGLSLPKHPPPELIPFDPIARRQARDTLALAALVAHRKLRLTQAQLPDRGMLKRLTKNLGIEVDEAEKHIVTAVSFGWLVVSAGDQLIPEVVALTTAEHAVSSSSPYAKYAAALGVDGWTSLAALARSSGRQVQPSIEVGRLEHLLPAHPFFQLVQHEGATWVRKCPERPAGGDGHVTPSFEVLLGPAASLKTVARVALCCELQRLDHVLTLKLTPSSVASARAVGLSESEIRAGLSEVGPHGLPDNVAVMLEDWLAAVRTVRVRSGKFIFTDDDDTAARLLQVLGDKVIDSPAPRVLELQPSLTEVALAAAMTKARVIEAHGAVTPTRLAAQAQSQPPMHLQPDAELLARFARACELGEYGVSPLIVTKDEVDDETAMLKQALKGQRAPKQATEILECCAEWHKAELERLTAWVGDHPASAQAMFEFDFAFTMNLLPWLVLNDELRKQTLQQAKDPESLLASAGKLMKRSGTLRRGAEDVIAKMQQSRVREALVEVLDGQGTEDDDDWDALDELDDLAADRVESESYLRVHEPAFAQASSPPQRALPAPHEPPVFRRAREVRKMVLAATPRAGTLSTQGPAAVRALLAEAAAATSAVYVQMAAGRVLALLTESLTQRGRDTVVHGIELASLEARAIKLVDLVAAQAGPPVVEVNTSGQT